MYGQAMEATKTAAEERGGNILKKWIKKLFKPDKKHLIRKPPIDFENKESGDQNDDESDDADKKKEMEGGC
jgi:hypothetical protein